MVDARVGRFCLFLPRVSVGDDGWRVNENENGSFDGHWFCVLSRVGPSGPRKCIHGIDIVNVELTMNQLALPLLVSRMPPQACLDSQVVLQDSAALLVALRRAEAFHRASIPVGRQ